MNLNRHDHKVKVATMFALIVAGFIVNLGFMAYAQDVKKKEAAKEEESFTRPKPKRQIRPEIPSANRYRDDKVFLEYADSLYKVPTYDTIERQIVKGKVKFRQAGMWMYCDSAYYYPNQNSLDAFGNVRMEQGDTLFVYADKLYYQGNERMARLKNGPSCEKVKLINRDVTLTTDSLDYDLGIELGWYSRWGTIDDKVNTLTSLYGEYSPGTKNADFYRNVVLVNNEDGYTMLTDTLHYNTNTHIARIESETEIQGANDTIITTRGIYDTQIGNAELLTRSMIIHRDSTDNVTTLEGDSIIYDKATRISRAYMFRDPLKHGMPMVITDTAHRTTLIGGFGIYNDSTREALACEYPMLMEYSQGDTLFLRADTIKTYIITEMVAGSRRWTVSGYPEFNRLPIVKAIDYSLWIDSTFFTLIPPMYLRAMALLDAAAPKQPQQKEEKPIVPVKPDPIKEMDLQKSELPGDSIAERSIGDSIAVRLSADSIIKPRASADSIVKDSIPLFPKEFHIALAYHRARFFKQDLQGVADSMVVVEKDSMLYMFRKPIVWTGERQVTGNRIDVHFNDSTADWAFLPESGLLSEHIGEDLYNQLAGKKMYATFAEQTLKDLEVSGNVQTIFLPQESDSTYNRLVTAESSYLTIEMDSGQIKKLKMWPETTGSVIPLFLLKRGQQYLPQFRWWISLRPIRERYGDRLHWQDNLGEVSDELDQYFEAPSDFGAPQSFPESRPDPVATNLVTPFQSSKAPINTDEIPAQDEDTVVDQDEIEAIEDSEQQMQEENEAIEENSEEIEKDTVEDEKNHEEIDPSESSENTNLLNEE